jgi:ribonuclease HI
MIEIFTDGKCNNGVGGWAFLIRCPEMLGAEIQNSGEDTGTTAHRMQLTAIIEALNFISGRGRNIFGIVIYTTSHYVKWGKSG